MRFHHSAVSACLLLIPMVLPSPGRAGEMKPYEGTFNFTATYIDTTTGFVQGDIDGHETHLGRIEGQVEYLVSPDGSFVGALVKSAANGDTLKLTTTGQFIPGGSKGGFTFTGGSGRFQDASGGGTFVGRWVVYPYTAVVDFTGSISY
jgi:hypothetical protein